ncbi:MAG: translation initiation factor IF-2, partial [Chloroflexi bacterium]|nr:translation initiation factor IF-2 [Chloroflexota bacterium]
SKAAREFNVGIGTIVEFLHKKGFDVDASPNTKLSPEMYDYLNIEYKGEKTVKEEARRKDVGSCKHETISIEDSVREDVERESYEDEGDIFIRGLGVEIDKDFKEAIEPRFHKDEKKEAVEEKEPEVAITETEEPKVIVVEAKAEEKIEKKIEEKKGDEKKEKGKEDKKEEPVKAPPVDEAKESAGVAPDQTQLRPAAEIPDKEKVEKKPVATGDEKPEDKDKVASESQQPKVIGEIDLSAINERTKPAKKTAKEKRNEREDQKRLEIEKRAASGQKSARTEKKEVTKELKPTSPVETKKDVEVKPDAKIKETIPPVEKKQEQDMENFFKTKVEKLQGPNIVGKIDLPEIKKPEGKKPVASSTDDKLKPKKKKRRRIRKDTPVKDTSAKPREQQRSDDKKARYQKGRKPRSQTVKVEPTEEEIQKQIKETLARLSGSGGKSKASKHRRQKRDLVSKQAEKDRQIVEKEKSVLTVTEFVTANELASMMDISVTEVISMCMQIGLFVSINQRLDAETITLLAGEFGFTIEFTSVDSAIDNADDNIDDPKDLVHRAPIVTVMGHVDHGKTKLLDYIRDSNVIAGEAGGITQHIGAYEVKLENGKNITFLDTPGHEAFTAMRARGAQVTDVAIIVIAADDSVMPQTKEAINHALAANVPIVFAINKMDKPTANSERIKDQLSQMNVLVEDWGGKYQSQEISAKAGLNIDDLLDKVLLEAEMLDLKGNFKRYANGTIVESSLDKGRGYVAKLLVQNGTLKVGDLVLAGSHFGRVKAMYNERNQAITSAGPSTPVLMLGMNSAPQAGDAFKIMEDEREAKNIANKRMQLQREQGLRTQKHITLDEIGRRIAIGDFKELNIIVKGDVDGSAEALSDSLLKLTTEEVQVNVIHKSVGQVTETDVLLASASNAVIVGFQVRPSIGARKLAEKEQIDIRLYSIIYSAIEEIKSAIEGMLSPDIEEKILSNIEVREVFKITKVGTIAGCMVLDGVIHRNNRIRLIRDGIVIYTGKLGSLKRFKDDVKEVNSGYECGLNIENFNDIKVGDIVEAFEEISVARKLD